MFANILSAFWWAMLIRGILWIIFGIFVFSDPRMSALTLTLFIGALFFLDGVSNVVSAIGGRREQENWWLLLLTGFAGIGVGLLTYLNPSLTVLALLFYIAIWAIATGLLEIGAALRLRKEIEGEFFLILAGLISVAFGVLIMARPARGALAVLFAIGVYAVAFGATLVVLSIRAREFPKRLSEAGHRLRPA